MQLLDIATYFTSERDVSRVARGPLDDAGLRSLYAYPPRPRRPWIRANFVSSIDGAVTADGVSAGLGTAADKRVFTILRELADAGATVLLVSQRESARAIADQIVTVTVSEVMA